MRQQRQIVIDLPMFIGPGSTEFSVAVQDAQAVQPIARGGIQQPFGLLIVCPGGRLFARRFMADQPG
ncbi:MAG: hypothetical protein BWX84_02519 [Verrucomicrobia bacterium ADurb.Bin118]|nr:MAG: hypothetical protein BWX84_02519 [Verrucomicrobia bacterium ADurb.Bin118]